MSALAFPLPVEAFALRLPVSEVAFDIEAQQEVTGLASGAFLRADVGPKLWVGEMRLRSLGRAQADALAALIAVLQRPGASFLACDPRYDGPQADPGAMVLHGHAPEILALDPADRRILSLAGLPAGYVLRRGDLLSFPYAVGSLALIALHRVVATEIVADADGETGWIEVVPHVRAGAVAGAAVELRRPACKAVLLDGASAGRGRAWNTGAVLPFRQVLS